MGRLTRQEIQQIRKVLEKRGLTYPPLQDEVLDHLICDIEHYMAEGLDFHQAWQKVDEEIPKNQFTNIQTETMEILNKKISATKIMTLLSLFLLVAATTFKLLHLKGAGILLIVAFEAIALTILISILKGFYAIPAKKGRFSILGIGLLIVIFIASIEFQMLHWKGAIPLRLFSMIGLTLLFPALSIYFFRSKQTAQDHPLILLIEENRTSIERVLLGLVGFGIIFKIPTIFEMSQSNFAPVLYLILTIFIAGLYLFTLTWKPYVSTLTKKNRNALGYLLVTSIIAFVLFMLPGMNWVFTEKVRSILSLSFYIFIGIIVLSYYLYYSQDKQRNLLALCTFLILLIPLLRLCVDTGVLYGNPAALIFDIIYNAGVLFGLILLLIVFYKKPVFRAFMLLMLAQYTFTYPVV